MHAQDHRMLPVMDMYARLSRRDAMEDKNYRLGKQNRLLPRLNHQDYWCYCVADSQAAVFIRADDGR
ncbi:MAG: hypothetical protein B7Z70_11205 [Acidithiobacillus ferrivorans]|uniref:Uncharacterized protein n=1 Tax=Acidithiobacillus ferrivorans TaxID=160808 RepID=A0A257SPN8_9PROT|nr:MAG: hypothetical protein B7Z70_11205 [Acidithiobacillus ferrivorans]